MTNRQINVLFTSAGRRVELLRAFRNSYTELGISGRIVAIDIDPLAPAFQASDRQHLVPRVNSTAYIPELIDICQREEITLVFPLIDPDIQVLAAHRSEIEATGARLAVVNQEAALIAADKWETINFFKSLGLATPLSWLPGQVDADKAKYPLFIKPRRGSASLNTFLVRNKRELEFFIDYVPDPVIQEYLQGPEITSDVICDLDGKVMGVVSRRRIEVRWGEVAKGVTVGNSTIIESCIKIAHALPAIGPITVQCMMKAGVPHFTEINARFGGGAPLGIAAGADYPSWFLARAARLDIEIPPIGSYQAGLYITRYDDSLFLSEGEFERS